MKEKLTDKKKEVSNFLQDHIKKKINSGTLSRNAGTLIRLNKELKKETRGLGEFETEIAIEILGLIQTHLKQGLEEQAVVAASAYRNLAYNDELIISQNL